MIIWDLVQVLSALKRFVVEKKGINFFTKPRHKQIRRFYIILRTLNQKKTEGKEKSMIFWEKLIPRSLPPWLKEEKGIPQAVPFNRRTRELKFPFQHIQYKEEEDERLIF